VAHSSQLRFIQLLAQQLGEFFVDKRVLEVGSLDINGSVRSCFSRCEYIGLDVAAGKGVDVVCQGQDYDAPDASFDVVLSCEAMEHNPYWKATFLNMIRLCRPGGLLIMSCASTGRMEHGTARSEPTSSPLTVGLGWNYYRNLRERDFRRAVDLVPSVAAHKFWVNWSHYDLLFAGLKGAQLPPGELLSRWQLAVASIDGWIGRDAATPMTRYRRTAAALFGDAWFHNATRIGKTLVWLHEARK
jgi:SAM-dependent methyltransferase